MPDADLPQPDDEWIEHALDAAYLAGFMGADGRLTRAGLLVAPVLATAAEQLASLLLHRGLLRSEVLAAYSGSGATVMAAARYYDDPRRAALAADLLSPEDSPR